MLCEFLAENSHVRFPQNVSVMKVNFMDRHTAFSPVSPTHLPILNVVKPLPRPLEKHNRSTETGYRKTLRPVCFPPVGPSRLGSCKFPYLVRGHPLVRRQSLGNAQIPHLPDSLPVVMDLPQESILAVLQHPGIEDGK